MTNITTQLLMEMENKYGAHNHHPLPVVDPVYWTIQWENPATFENAKQQLSDVISRDKNRASVIIWSMANETPMSDARNNFLKKLAETARSLGLKCKSCGRSICRMC